MDRTKIEWTDATWNPLRGCTRVSEGCRNCYAETVAARFSGPGHAYEGLAKWAGTPREARWTGKVVLVDKAIDQPLRWREPRRIFVNSMSDLFHEAVPYHWIDRIFAVMAMSPQHVFQVLTKRPQRMRSYIAGAAGRVYDEVVDKRFDQGGSLGKVVLIADPLHEPFAPPGPRVYLGRWPLPNVWLGTSVEDQAAADERIPLLLDTLAAVRFISAEPLLGLLDLTSIRFRNARGGQEDWNALADEGGTGSCLDWVIAGGESGPNARPMSPTWARSLRDQCADAGVPFFFKQWGNWVGATVYSKVVDEGGLTGGFTTSMTETGESFPGRPTHWWSGDFRAGTVSIEVGKRAAGRLLDGRTYDEMPAHPA